MGIPARVSQIAKAQLKKVLMGSSFANNLALDDANGYEFSAETFTPPSRVDQLLQALGPKMMAMGGLALFAFALVVAFRIIALDSVRQLQQPAIDFAICGAVAFLGLSISWVHLGDRPRVEADSEDQVAAALRDTIATLDELAAILAARPKEAAMG